MTTRSTLLRRKRLWPSWAALVFLLASAASAGPEARVRVRGSSRINATATATSDGLVLKGALLEDAGRPVPHARIRVRQVGPDGSTRLLRHAEACASAANPGTNEPARQGEEVIAVTDAAGRFCVRWSSDLPTGRLILSFDDTRALLDPSEQAVEVQRIAAFEIEFARLPRAVSLDAPEVTLELASRARAGTDVGPLPFTLLWTRVGAPTATLLDRSLHPGEGAILRFPSRHLGGPGPGELRARLGTGEQTAEAHAQIVATATVLLDAPTNVALPANGEGSLMVRVISAAGVVGTGSVEALTGDRTVGIAAVSGGEASVPLSLGSGPFTAPVVLRYLPASPWWLAGPPEQVLVSVPKASAWRVLFWAAALLAIAGYIAAAWRRPPRLSTKQEAAHATTPETATLHWIAPEKGVGGWTGTVRDAHDGLPIAGATVILSTDGGVERRAVTEPDGSFGLPAFEASSASGQLRIEAPWHSPFDGELPPPGLVTITLVTRRRALLARLVEWTRKRGAPWAGAGEPTPGELAQSADALAHGNVSAWARAVEAAAFGPVAVDPTEEARVRALEPDTFPHERHPSGQNDPA